MDKSKANPLKPPIEDLQGQVYQHELGDPDREEQIDRVLDEWGRRASAEKRARKKKSTQTVPRKKEAIDPLLQSYKHLLIAIDSSEASDRILTYVAGLMAGRRDVHLLLLHVAKTVPPELLEFGGSENPAEEEMGEAALEHARKDWIELEQRAAAPMFTSARALLREGGIPEEVVDTKIVASNPNESLDAAILEVAHEEHCGTVIVGSAAFLRSRELLHPHFAEVQPQKASAIALWVVH